MFPLQFCKIGIFSNCLEFPFGIFPIIKLNLISKFMQTHPVWLAKKIKQYKVHTKLVYVKLYKNLLRVSLCENICANLRRS